MRKVDIHNYIISKIILTATTAKPSVTQTLCQTFIFASLKSLKIKNNACFIEHFCLTCVTMLGVRIWPFNQFSCVEHFSATIAKPAEI